MSFDFDDSENLLARLASTGRMALVCAHSIHRLLNEAIASLPGPDRDWAVSSAAEIVRRLLTSAHRVPGTATAVELSEVADDTRALLGVLVPEALVVCVRDRPHVRTWANRSDIDQIIWNVLHLTTSPESARRTIIITTSIEVRDGQEFASLAIADEHDREPTSWTELALPFARDLAVRNGGHLVVGVRPDGVSRTCVLLPIAAG